MNIDLRRVESVLGDLKMPYTKFLNYLILIIFHLPTLSLPPLEVTLNFFCIARLGASHHPYSHNFQTGIDQFFK